MANRRKDTQQHGTDVGKLAGCFRDAKFPVSSYWEVVSERNLCRD